MFVLSHIIFSLKKRKRNHLSLSHADIKTPRNFNLKSKNDETHDFAMAILEREITFTDSVRPICIPRQVRTQGNGWANWVKAATRNWNLSFEWDIDQFKGTKLQNMEFGGSKAIAAGWGRWAFNIVTTWLNPPDIQLLLRKIFRKFKYSVLEFLDL